MVLPVPALLGTAARAAVVVRPGETLSEIAERHGVSLSRLMQANGITNPDLVVVGSRLVIPGSGGGGTRGGGTVTVQPGDTLSDIAARHGLSTTRLMQLNGISNPDLVMVGQRLVVGGTSRTAAAPASALPTAPYTVKSGETLSEIAARFGTSTDRLIQLNRISDPNLVVTGTRLAIPGRPSSSSAGSGGSRPGQHVVQPGENLSTIAERYGMSVDRLIAINNISDPDTVWAGSRLRLQQPPAPKPAPRPASRPAPAPAKPVAKAAPKPAATPARQAEQPAPQPAPTASEAPSTTASPEASPSPQPATSSADTSSTDTIAAATSTAESTPTTKPAPTTKPTPTAATTTTAMATAKATSKPAGADWRSYGPLQVDWSNWQPMGGSYVAPTLSGDGQALYLAVNCGARKLNATSQAGQWKSWDAPQTDFEQRLISDLCKAKGA
jgi:LysM repeat protein